MNGRTIKNSKWYAIVDGEELCYDVVPSYYMAAGYVRYLEQIHTDKIFYIIIIDLDKGFLKTVDSKKITIQAIMNGLRIDDVDNAIRDMMRKAGLI